MKNNAATIEKDAESSFDPTVFGKRVREARKNKGWNQIDLALEVFRSEGGYVSDVERGKLTPSFDVVVSMADKLGVSLDYLCGREEYMNNKPITMGDVARVFMLLPFLDGIECEVVDADVVQNNTAGEKKSTKKKRVAVIRVGKKPLNKFLDKYGKKLEYRMKYPEFVEWREKELEKLDAIPVWESRDLEKWRKQVDPSDSWSFPEEKFKPLIWNRNFPYLPKNIDE